MKKIKILRIIARLNIGGPAINAILLTEGLSDDFESVLATGQVSPEEGDISYLAKEKAIEPVFIQGLGRQISWLNDIKSFWAIFKLIRKEKPDILHTHTAKAGLLGRLAATLAGVPIKVHTFHGHIFCGYFSPAKSTLFIWIERFLAIFTERIITVGQAVKEELCSRFKIASEDKIEVLHLGFELDKFLACQQQEGRLKDELNIPQDCFLVGIVGRLTAVKNHRMFLDAASKLLSQLSAKFLIIGDGELRSDLECYARQLGIEQDVIFLGWRRDLDVIYAGLDVVCLTSLNEGTPVSLIEAQASGRPAVSTDVGSVRDVVKNGTTGILVKSEDTDAFSRAIAELLKDKQRRNTFGVNAKEAAKIKFSKKRLIQDTESLYQRLLEEKGMMQQ